MPAADDLGPDPEPGRDRTCMGGPPAPPRELVLVVGYDGSAPARAAVDLATERVAREGGRLVIVHAGPHGRPLDGLLLEGHDRLADLDWEARALDGSAARVLAGVARSEKADEIVVGSRGRGRTGALRGSTVERLVATAPCPVTVVPAVVAERLEQSLVT